MVVLIDTFENSEIISKNTKILSFSVFKIIISSIISEMLFIVFNYNEAKLNIQKWWIKIKLYLFSFYKTKFSKLIDTKTIFCICELNCLLELLISLLLLIFKFTWNMNLTIQCFGTMEQKGLHLKIWHFWNL